MKKILITGAAGFIGYHLSKKLLDDKYEIWGVDNINDYYDPQLKENRLKYLTNFSNFNFKKLDISDKKTLKNIFLKFEPEIVVNLAAQAGVRYSIKNPYAYLDSNLTGFLNIIELCRHQKVNGLVYASSSSVYGLNKKMPFSTTDKTDTPIALYGATKKANELIAHAYSHLYELNTTGLRYFTVYGPWGRPDMAPILFSDAITRNKKLKIFNHGDIYRDFTFVDDIIDGIIKVSNKDFKLNYQIFNIGNSKPVNVLYFVDLLEKELNIKANKELCDMQPGDVKKTWADIEKFSELTGYKPKIKIEQGVKKFIDWYKFYYEV